MYMGKLLRLRRLINPHTQRTLIVPMDHGVSVGPTEGIKNMVDTIGEVAEAGADAVLVHKGLMRCINPSVIGKACAILHLSASTRYSPAANSKCLVAGVEEAMRHGADAVSVHVNLGDPDEGSMLKDLGRVAEACCVWGMPLLAMVYGRGPRIADGYNADVVAHCARVGAELGADIVKVVYTGDQESFAKVVESCCVPVVIAGGPCLGSARQVLEMTRKSLDAGGAGVSIGRNVFQAPHRKRLVKAMRAVIHDGLGVDGALAMLGN